MNKKIAAVAAAGALLLSTLPALAGHSPLVARYHLNKDAKDSSGHDHDGTVNGASLTRGRFGRALDFNGVDDYIGVPDNDAWDFTLHDGTIEFWFKINSLSMPSSAAGLISQVNNDSNWAVYYHPDGKISVGKAGINKIDSAPGILSEGIWYHAAVIKSGNVTSIYVNGTQRASGTASVWTNSANPLKIGGHRFSDTDYYHNGLIDEVRIWNCALTADDIAQHAKSNSVASPSCQGN